MAQFETAERNDTAALTERFFQHAPDMLCVVDCAGRFRRVNPAWQHALGYTPDELEGCAAGDIAHPDDPVRELRAALQGDGATTRRYYGRFRHRDGGWRWLEWSGAVDAEDGLIHATVRDVTEQRSDATHRAEIEARSGVGTWELDVDSRRLWWSTVTHAIHGTDPATYTPDVEAALAFYPPEAAARLRGAIEALRTQGQSYRLELPFITRQGEPRWVRCTAVAELRGGQLARVHGTI